MSKPTPEPTMKEMKKWLKGMKKLAGRLQSKPDVAIIDAVLAVLEERGGVSEEERADILDWFHWALGITINGGYEYPGNPDTDLGKLEKLILGNRGGAVTEEEDLSEPHEQIQETSLVSGHYEDDIEEDEPKAALAALEPVTEAERILIWELVKESFQKWGSIKIDKGNYRMDYIRKKAKILIMGKEGK